MFEFSGINRELIKKMQQLANIVAKLGIETTKAAAATQAMSYAVISEATPGSLSKQLPGVRSLVIHPVSGRHSELRSVIIDLNDNWKWSREKIADWLETLDIDITF